MHLSVLDIQVPRDAPSSKEEFVVRVHIEIDGFRDWHGFTVEPLTGGLVGLWLVRAPQALYDLLGGNHTAVHRLAQLVNQRLERGDLHLPQRVAA